VSYLPLTLGSQICGDLAAASAREWILPDGLGGYAMGTISGLRTRRYHALLVATGAHPGDRRVGLVSLDPVVTIGTTSWALGVHEWATGAIAPNGHLLLESFTHADGLPVWRWRIGDTVIERRIATAHGRAAVGVVHRLLAGPPVTLTLNALGTWRDAHGERTAAGPAPTMERTVDGAVIDGAYRVAGPGFTPDGTWYLGAHLREEAARGLAADEDLWSIGRFTADLTPGETLEVTAWAGDLDTPPPPARDMITAHTARARDLITTAKATDAVDAALALAADAFVIDGPDVVAGYPWFGAWSRDTMTSYEGLFLTSGRAALGRNVLRRYAAALADGMLPNTADISDATGAPEFNSVDAPLWFIHAVGRHVAVTGDTDLAAELLPGLATIIDAYAYGTRYGIGLDTRGLITAGTPDTSLTWMDARVNGHPVTPRNGSPVEINALWCNALGTMAAMSGRAPGGRDADWFEQRRDKAVAAFTVAYTGPSWPDVVTETGNDDAVRPNQLLAYALPYGPLRGHVPPAVIDARLLTPLGLRTLDPSDPAYQGLHLGDGAARDHAYHQGTVWPWLIGPYVTARHEAGLPTAGLLDGLIAHLGEYGIGSISETACGDTPHIATGCPFQAWSVAQTWQARRLVGP
jgi:predicted glycogen debranching enzyme